MRMRISCSINYSTPSNHAPSKMQRNSYTPQQRLFIYDLKQQGTKYPAIQAAFLLKFGCPAPSRSHCKNIVRNVTQRSSAVAAKPSGRPSSYSSANDMLELMDSLIQNPDVGVRRQTLFLEQDHGWDTSHMTVWRRIRHELKVRPYHYQMKQQLQQQDPAARLRFGNFFQRMMTSDPYFEDQILYEDEANIHLCGYINSRNAVHYGLTKPAPLTTPLHPIKVVVLGAISSQKLFGPYFVEQGGNPVRIPPVPAKATTLDGVRYTNILDTELIPDYQREIFSNPQDWDPYLTHYMHDGARAHIVGPACTLLDSTFFNNTIGANLSLPWPPRSPDLTPMDFFLWGYVKEQLFRHHKPTTYDELKAAVREVFQSIPTDMLQRACRSVKKRIQLLQQENGGHFEHLL